MNNPLPVIVTDSTGRQGRVEFDAPGLQSKIQALLHFEGMQPVAIPVGMLALRQDGQYELPISIAELTAHASQAAMEQSTVIPVIAEEVQIGKRQVETGRVRIQKVVHEHQELVDIPLLQEEIEIVRVPINRVVDSLVAVRQEGETLIVSVLEEVLVVQKQLWLKEEVHITTKRSERHQPEQVTLRREEVMVESADLKTKPVQP